MILLVGDAGETGSNLLSASDKKTKKEEINLMFNGDLVGLLKH